MNSEMAYFPSYSHLSARKIRMELTIGHLQDGFMIINTTMCRTIARSMARMLFKPGLFFSLSFFIPLPLL